MALCRAPLTLRLCSLVSGASRPWQSFRSPGARRDLTRSSLAGSTHSTFFATRPAPCSTSACISTLPPISALKSAPPPCVVRSSPRPHPRIKRGASPSAPPTGPAAGTEQPAPSSPSPAPPPAATLTNYGESSESAGLQHLIWPDKSYKGFWLQGWTLRPYHSIWGCEFVIHSMRYGIS